MRAIVQAQKQKKECEKRRNFQLFCWRREEKEWLVRGLIVLHWTLTTQGRTEGESAEKSCFERPELFVVSGFENGELFEHAPQGAWLARCGPGQIRVNRWGGEILSDFPDDGSFRFPGPGFLLAVEKAAAGISRV